MKFYFQKRNKDNNDDGQQPVPPQEIQPPQQPVPPQENQPVPPQQPQYQPPQQPVPPQENQPVPPQQPQYQPPQQPVPPQQPQYQPPQQPVPPQNYDPYAFQREQYKKQRNRRLIAQGLVALILLLAVFDGNPVNAFVDTTPVGEVIDSVKNRLNSVLGREGASSNNTSTQNGDTGSTDNSNENSPAGAAASEVSCDFDKTPYLSPLEGALETTSFGLNTDSPYFLEGYSLQQQLLTFGYDIDFVETFDQNNAVFSEDIFINKFLELSSQTLINYHIDYLTKFSRGISELQEQDANDPDFKYGIALQLLQAEIYKDEVISFYIGNLNDNDEVTKIKLFLNRNIISEFELKDIKQQPIQILYFDSSEYLNTTFSSDIVKNAERLEEIKILFGEKDGLLVNIDVEGIVGHDENMNIAIQIGDDQGCWSEPYSVDRKYRSTSLLFKEAAEEWEEFYASEEEAEEEDNSGVVGSGPLITIPDISSINPGNIINPNILEGVELISDCSNDVLVPYISGGSHNSNTVYRSTVEDITVARDDDGYVRGIFGPEDVSVNWLFTLQVTDNCPFGNVTYPLLNSVEVNYVNRLENTSSTSFSTQAEEYPINVSQYYDGIRIWAEMLNVERDSDCALFYDSYVANGTYAKQIPFHVFLNQSSANAPYINEYSIGFDPLAANLCPGTYTILYSLLDASGNVTEVKYLNNIILEVNVREALARG